MARPNHQRRPRHAIVAAGAAAAIAAAAVFVLLRPHPEQPLPLGATTESFNEDMRDFIVTDTRKVQPSTFSSNESVPDPKATVAEPGSHYNAESLERQKAAAQEGALGREIAVPARPIVVGTVPPSPVPNSDRGELRRSQPAGFGAPADSARSGALAIGAAPAVSPPTARRSGPIEAAARVSLGFAPRIAQKVNGDAIRDSPAPPDLQVAIGPRYLILVNNSKLVMWGKSGKTIDARPVYSQDIRATGNHNGRYNGIFPVKDGLRLSDPWMQYSRAMNRLFIVAVQFDRAYNSELLLAVSRDDDPRHGWTVFPITGLNKNGVLHDQPKLAINGDHVAIAWTEIQGPPPGYSKGAMWAVLSMRELLGAKPRVVATGSKSPLECDAGLIPVKSTSAADDSYFVELVAPDQPPNCRRPFPAPRANPDQVGLVGNDLRIIRVAGSVAKKSAKPRVSDFEVPAYSAPEAAAQQRDPKRGGSGMPVDTGDTRLLSAVLHDREIWTAGNLACRVKGTRQYHACFQIFRVPTNGSRESVSSYTVGDEKLEFFDPAIAINPRGDVFVAFESSSASTFPSPGFTVHRAGGDYAWKPFVIEYGRGVLNCIVGRYNRVGDYLGIDVDAANDVVWAAVEVSTDRSRSCSQETIISALVTR